MQAKIAQIEGVLNSQFSLSQKMFTSSIELIDFLLQESSGSSVDRAALRALKRRLTEKFELSGDPNSDLAYSEPQVSPFGIYTDVESRTFSLGAKKQRLDLEGNFLLSVKHKYRRLLIAFACVVVVFMCFFCVLKFI